MTSNYEELNLKYKNKTKKLNQNNNTSTKVFNKVLIIIIIIFGIFHYFTIKVKDKLIENLAKTNKKQEIDKSIQIISNQTFELKNIMLKMIEQRNSSMLLKEKLNRKLLLKKQNVQILLA